MEKMTEDIFSGEIFSSGWWLRVHVCYGRKTSGIITEGFDKKQSDGDNRETERDIRPLSYI